MKRDVSGWLLTAIVLIAVLVRYLIIANVIGTQDLHAWTRFGAALLDDGLIATYHADKEFNHPPLMGLWAELCMWLYRHAGLWYPIGFKSLAVIGDVLAAAALMSWWTERQAATSWKFAPHAVVAAFLFNPVSLLMTCFHGNTDSMLGALCLIAALLAQRNRPFLAGLVLAAAFNVKLVPVFLVPPLVLSQPNRRAMLQLAAGVAFGLVPFLPVLALAGRDFYAHAIAYNSNAERWGLQLFLQEAATAPRIAELAIWLRHAFEAVARYVIAAVSVGLGLWCWRGRRGQPLVLAAIMLSVFLLLSPGFGVQYLVWPVALIFAVDRWAAIRWVVVAGVTACLLYNQHWNGQFVNAEVHLSRPMDTIVCLFGLLSWLVLLRFVARQMSALRSIAADTAPASS